MQHLKLATQKAHDEIESLVPLMNPCVTMSDYALYLRSMYGFIAPLERAWKKLPSDFQGTVELLNRLKSDRLRGDLLAMADSEPETATIRRPAWPPSECQRLPSCITVEQGLGSMYVIEGAMLGGRVIARHLTKVLGETISLQFLLGYGDQLSTMWRNFGDALEQWVVAGALPVHAIIDSANQTFSALSEWLRVGKVHHEL